MGKLYDEIEASLRAFIEAQHVFFVATAPLSESGHVNLSPKGLDTFRILAPDRVAYLDHVGSGAETIAHLKENGRIVLMWCAFQGPPRIVRLHGRGAVRDPSDARYGELRTHFPATSSERSIVEVSVRRISDSCGYGVPLYRFEGERSQLTDWADRKGSEGVRRYQLEKNRSSLDGLPAVTWVESDRSLDSAAATPSGSRSRENE